MSDYMDEGSGFSQILTALWAGLRLSLKTAGAVTLFSFVFVTLLGFSSLLRLEVGILASLIFSTLFMARFPYYREFNSTFGLEVLNGLHENVFDIISTVLLDYGLIWRFPVAIILTVVCIAILSRLLNIKTFPMPYIYGTLEKVVFVVPLVVALIVFGVFVRFGGSFSFSGGINWENAGITDDNFLNECILDDGQAMYRVWSISKLTDIGEIDGVDKKSIVTQARFLADDKSIDDDMIDPFLERKAKGARIDTPRHIFIIIGENWMQWPMLGKYYNLHISDGIKSIIAEPNAYYSRNFMPNGDFTYAAVTGFVTGLSDVKINVNYQPKTYSEIYLTSPAPQLKELGYQVDFWYGGNPSWENISKMTRAQGFDNFYGYPNLNAPKQTVWGAKDEDLFNAIKNHLAEEPPTVHFILTTSNHPPYNLDLEKEGYDLDATLAEIKKLPKVDDAERLAVELGHYWYMDKVTTKFIREVSAAYPDSLFVVTGDHAVRTDPSTRPTIFEHQSVPFVMYGKGIKPDILPPDVVGGHTSIIPTIIELIAPEGFIYYSVAPSLFSSTNVAFNNHAFVTRTIAGEIDSDAVEILPHVASAALNQIDMTAERESAEQVIKAMRTVSWWLITQTLQMVPLFLQ